LEGAGNLVLAGLDDLFVGFQIQIVLLPLRSLPKKFAYGLILLILELLLGLGLHWARCDALGFDGGDSFAGFLGGLGLDGLLPREGVGVLNHEEGFVLRLLLLVPLLVIVGARIFFIQPLFLFFLVVNLLVIFVGVELLGVAFLGQLGEVFLLIGHVLDHPRLVLVVYDHLNFAAA